MARVQCEIVEDYLENDSGTSIESVIATCGRCGHVTKCYGRTDRSRQRCLVLMREQCPNEENNFYVE